jgi:cyclic di-GMP phosphodiesterase
MKGKILVVEDHPSSRAGLEALLRTQGLEVATAGDAKRAFKELARFRPDLLLLDVMLPDLTGFEVCRRIKQDAQTRLTPVVLVTGLSATEDRVQGIEAGADDFLTKPIDRSELMARVSSLLSLKAYTDELERAEAVLFALALSIEAKDPYTRGHCERLAEYSVLLGEHQGLSEEEITALRRAGFVHDIGKVAIPDHILLKEGPLTSEEEFILRAHPCTGEQICAPLKSFRAVLPIIRHHHEKMDGSGYPDGLKGEKIPLTARILQVADVYDALTTKRPYKPAFAPTEALDVMENEVRKGWRDPLLVKEFRQLVEGNVNLFAPESQPQMGGTSPREFSSQFVWHDYFRKILSWPGRA